MSDPDPLIHRAAEAVADGIVVDWDAAAARLNSLPQRALLQNLRDIREFAQPPQHATKASEATAGIRGLSFVTLIAAIATLQVAVALIGFFGGPADASEIPAIWQFLLLSAFAVSGLGLVIGGRQDRRAVLLGTFHLVVATSFAQRFIGRIAGSPRPVWASLYLEAFGPYLLWGFVQAFPRVERFSRDDTRASYAVPLAFVVGCALMAVNLVLAFAGSDGPAMALALFGRWQTPSNFYWAIISLLTLTALVAAPFRARSAAVSERRRVIWFLLGVGLGAVPLLAELVFEVFFPSIVSSVTPGSLAVVIYPFLASIPVTTAYAVMVERVVEVSFVVRRTLQYALAKAAIVGLTIAPIVVLAALGLKHRNLTIGELIGLPVGRLLVATALIGVVLMLVREPLLERIDRAFRRKTLALERATLLVTGKIRDAADVRELSDRVEPIVTEMLGSPRCVVLALNDAATAFESSRKGWPPLPIDSAVVALIGDDDEAIDFSRVARGGLFQVLPPSDKAWLEDTSSEVITPLRGRTGVLRGILALRAKESGLPFTKAELAAIRGMAGPIALVLDQILHARRRPVELVDEDAPAAECTSCESVFPGNMQTCGCGKPLRTAAVPQLLASKFRIERRLGAGAMGTVYLARDRALQRAVVIKALPRRVTSAARQLEDEARAMARVSDSRLALIFGVETWRGAPLLVMEYLAGGTLADRIRKGPLEPRAALTIGSTLARGLQVLHDSGMLHRDVKPTNIAFTADGLPKLLDFGLASLIEDADDPWRLVGTPLYLAPELTADKAPAPSNDLWSLSIVLYESISGGHPFASDTVEAALRMVAAARVPDLRTINPDIPGAVAELFNTLLAREPAQRPAHAAEMAERLEFVLAELQQART